MENLLKFCDEIGEKTYLWFNPELANHARPTQDWALVQARVALPIAFGYLIFVLVASLVMKAMKPVDKLIAPLKYAYNPIQVILCSWMCLEAARQAYRLPGAKLLDNAYVYERTQVADVLWWFYVSKILDFMDTVFIILGKKWRQLSFLHVYHHFSIFLTYWMIMNAGWDGDIYLTIVLNTFVHTCMYLYYMITALRLAEPVKGVKGPLFVKKGSNYEVVKGTGNEVEERVRGVVAKPYSPWWKKLITQLQMIQFMCMNAQGAYLVYLNYNDTTGERSGYPVRITIYYIVYIQSLFWLFNNFSKKTYKKGGKKKAN